MPVIYYVLFTVSVFPILLAFLSGYYRYREFGHFDNNNPREQQRQQTGIGARVVAAQHNAWETLILFLLVTFIAFASELDMDGLAGVSLLFLVLRVLHVVCYMADWSTLRSLVYVAANLCCVYIFVIAAANFE